MGVKLQHIEKLVHLSVAKPLSWALYLSTMVLVCLALASFRGIRWLIQKRASQRDSLRRKEEACARQY